MSHSVSNPVSGSDEGNRQSGSFWPLVMLGAVVFWSAAAWLHQYSPFHPQRTVSAAAPVKERCHRRTLPLARPRTRPIENHYLGDFPTRRAQPLGLADGRYPWTRPVDRDHP